MKVYVHDERHNGSLAQLCVSMGAQVMTQEDVTGVRRHAPAEAPSFFLQDVDALVLEVTRPTQALQFIIAQALLTHTPALCVYSKNMPPRELLHLVKQQHQPRSVKTFSYMPSTLPAAVQRFIRMHSDQLHDRDAIPSIKYTLRMTPRVDRYIQWRADTEHGSKADVLRRIIENLANNDTEYRDALVLFDEE